MAKIEFKNFNNWFVIWSHFTAVTGPKQLFVSMKFMAQLFHHHDQEENTNYHLLLRGNWSGGSRVNQKVKPSASLQWIRSCWKSGVSVYSQVCFISTWSGPTASLSHSSLSLWERSCWSRRSLLLITWTKKKNLLEENSMGCYQKQQCKFEPAGLITFSEVL